MRLLNLHRRKSMQTRSFSASLTASSRKRCARRAQDCGAKLRAPLIVGRRALPFFNGIDDWRTRHSLLHQLLVRARRLTPISRAQEQKQDSKRGVKVAT